MDIGTAKPGPVDRSAIPHHLIDIVDPSEQYDLGRFVADVDRCVAGIRARGRIPVLSGGTAFYISGFLNGPPGTPEAPPEIREALRAELTERGAAALFEELARVDPVSAEAIDRNDHYRVLRALEVYRASGRPRSSFAPSSTPRFDGEVTILALERPREELYRRIDARVREMMAGGLPSEAERLYAAGYGPETPGMRTIGYREFFEVAGLPPWSTVDLEAIEQRIARNTRRYAKRQETFFRRIPGVRSINADDSEAIESAIDAAIGEPGR